MSDNRQQIVTQIQEAFRNVSLGDGIGLREAQAIDDYESEQTRAAYRQADEKHNWSRIRTTDLNNCHSSLSFFDAEGMRFHLPAFLIADLQGAFTQDVVFHLTYSQHDNFSRFALFDTAQRQVVRDFLLLRLAELNEWPNNPQTPMIEQALAGFWAPQDNKPDC